MQGLTVDRPQLSEFSKIDAHKGCGQQDNGNGLSSGPAKKRGAKGF